MSVLPCIQVSLDAAVPALAATSATASVLTVALRSPAEASEPVPAIRVEPTADVRFEHGHS